MSPMTSAWKRGGYSSVCAYDCIRHQWWTPIKHPQSAVLADSSVELSAHAAAILGENGVARFQEFWSYEDGWEFGEGKALSQGSVTRLESFLERHPSFRRRPSLFLTQRGNLVLGWEDGGENTIELEFTPEGYSLFLAVTDEELEFSDGETSSLLEVLSRVEANGAP